MSWKEWAKITLFILTPLCLLLVLRSNEIKNDREQRIIAAEAKWERVKLEAAEAGIYTDIDAYLEANSGEAPRLLDDFPFVTDLIELAVKESFTFYEADMIEGLKKFPNISASMSSQEIIHELRSSLTKPPQINAPDKEVYKAFQSALDPIHEDLEKWKLATEQANSFSHSFYKNQNAHHALISVVRPISNILILRNYCRWKLGSSDTSDLKSVLKTKNLINEYAPSLVGYSIATSIEITLNDAILCALKNTSINRALAQELHNSISISDSSERIRTALYFEYVLQLSILNSLIETGSHYFIEEDSYFSEADILLEQRAGSANAFKSYFLDEESPHYIEDLSQTDEILENRISKIKSSRSEDLTFIGSALGIGFYYVNSLRSQMVTEIQKLQSACLLHKMDHNNYPESLSELIPTYLDTIPKIPRSGGTYIYKFPKNLESLPIIEATLSIPNNESIVIPYPSS